VREKTILGPSGLKQFFLSQNGQFEDFLLYLGKMGAGEGGINHICGNVNSWVRVTHKFHEHWFPTKNNVSTIIACYMIRLYLLSLVDTNGDWTSWSSCSKSCDVGVQSRTKSEGGKIIREELFCNLEYCPGKF
jgi:hypothetical protein